MQANRLTKMLWQPLNRFWVKSKASGSRYRKPPFFQEFPSGTLDMKIDELVDQLGMLDIQIEGRIDYDGSYRKELDKIIREVFS